MPVLGLRCCTWAFSICSARTSHWCGFSCWGAQTLAAVFRSCGAWISLLCSMWDLPSPGIEPVSPALADRLLTPGSPQQPCPGLSVCTCLNPYQEKSYSCFRTWFLSSSVTPLLVLPALHHRVFGHLAVLPSSPSMDFPWAPTHSALAAKLQRCGGGWDGQAHNAQSQGLNPR